MKLAASLDCFFDHFSGTLGDYFYWREMRALPLSERACRYASDICVRIFTVFVFIFFCKHPHRPLNRNYAQEKSDLTLRERDIIVILNTVNHIPNPEMFSKLERQSGHSIVFLSLDNVQQISQRLQGLKENGNRIKALWIRAHGNPDSIDIVSTPSANCFTGKEITLYASNAPLLTEINAKLERDAPIILESCCTGQFQTDRIHNIAQAFAANAEGRKVFAPTREVLSSDKSVSFAQGQFQVNLQGPKEPTQFLPGSFLYRIFFIWYAVRGTTVDVTQQF